MKNGILAVFVVVGLVSSVASQAQQRAVPVSGSVSKQAPVVQNPTAIKFQGNTLQVCKKDSKTGAVQNSCRHGYFPPSVGTVMRNVEVSFISRIRHTWIAVEEQNASLCYFETRTNSVHCLPIPAPLPQGMNVSYVDVTDAVRYLRFTTRPGMANQDPNGVAANKFMKAFMKAANLTRSNIKNSAKLVKLSGGAACSPAEVSWGLCVQSPHHVEDEGNEDGEGEIVEDTPRDNGEGGGGGDVGGGDVGGGDVGGNVGGVDGGGDGGTACSRQWDQSASYTVTGIRRQWQIQKLSHFPQVLPRGSRKAGVTSQLFYAPMGRSQEITTEVPTPP